jgi:Putative zinc-finger
MDPGSCADTRVVLPELALGIADGEERARALEHVATCSECRRELDELAAIADELVTMVPEREPPVGFEAGVLERLRAPTGRRPARRRLALAAAALAAAAVTAVAMVFAYRDDHRLASQYRAALMGANGKYFQSGRLLAADGTVVGTVFGYEGSPSWVFYVLDNRFATGAYEEQLVLRSGRTVDLPRFGLVDATWGIATPVPLRDIAAVRLIRAPRGPAFVAKLAAVHNP